MGTRMPIEEWPVGVECYCHPKLDKTPLTIYVYFWEVRTPFGLPPAPNLHVFACTQDDVDPCYWLYENRVFGWKVQVYYYCGSNATRIILKNNDGYTYCQDTHDGFLPEHSVMGNVNGWMTLFWLEAALKLIDDMVLPNDGHTFLEFFVDEDGHPVYKLCNVKFGMNEKYLLEP